jgi:hypothetical protein
LQIRPKFTWIYLNLLGPVYGTRYFWHIDPQRVRLICDFCGEGLIHIGVP